MHKSIRTGYLYHTRKSICTGCLYHTRKSIRTGCLYKATCAFALARVHNDYLGSLNEFCNRWCKREHVECDALKDWKLNIFKIIDRRISYYSQNTNMLPRKPKISYRYLKSGIEEFHSVTSQA